MKGKKYLEADLGPPTLTRIPCQSNLLRGEPLVNNLTMPINHVLLLFVLLMLICYFHFCTFMRKPVNVNQLLLAVIFTSQQTILHSANQTLAAAISSTPKQTQEKRCDNFDSWTSLGNNLTRQLWGVKKSLIKPT